MVNRSTVGSLVHCFEAVWLVGFCSLSMLSSFALLSHKSLLSNFIAKRVALTSRLFSSTSEIQMMNSIDKPKVVILAGATSAGKSASALELVRLLNHKAEIVVADSVQVYKRLDIGANKPTIEEISEVPHHLVDIYEVNSAEDVTAGEFTQRASTAIHNILRRGKLPIVVGGSTMWIQWLVNGVPDAPKASEYALAKAEELMGALERAGQWEEALTILLSYDAQERCRSISRNDWYRLRRYLEVALDLQNASKDLRLHNTRTPSPLSSYDVYSFFLIEEREQLYPTIDSRCWVMIQHGLLQEVGELLLEGALTPGHMGARAIGYRQCIEYFSQSDLRTADLTAFVAFLNNFGTATRNYARRQHNWYRKDTNFLFLNILRSQSSTDGQNSPRSPYIKVAEEMMKYISLPHDEYHTVLWKQINAAEHYAKLLNNKNLTSLEVEEAEEEEDYVLTKEVVQYILDERQGKSVQVLPGYTATNIGLRVSPGLNKKNKLRTFSSQLGKEQSERELMEYVILADQYRERLWKEQPDLMQRFRDEFNKNKTQEDEKEI